MTQTEEIDMLRRTVAELTEQVRTLEARPVQPTLQPLKLVPFLPYPPSTMPYAAPWTPISPVTCGDPMPMQPLATCVAQAPHWLAQSRGEV